MAIPSPTRTPQSPQSNGAQLSPDRFKLTPRSKIRALLADLDSDDENTPSGAPQEPFVSKDGTSRKAKALWSAEAVEKSTDAEDDTDEDEPVLPRGKLASRLQPPEQDQESAYDRVRKQLAASKHTRENSEPSAENVHTNDERFGDTEDNAQRLRSSESPQPASQASLHWSSSRSATTTPQKQPRHSSPGLFVSPEKSDDAHNSPRRASNTTSPAAPKQQDRLQALLARKREELQAKERERHITLPEDEESDAAPDALQEPQRRTKQSQKKAKRRQHKVVVPGEAESDDEVEDKDAAEKLTQQARPTRKASKKALEEMSRETQRMSRNMQLTHEAKTKIKFTKMDFFKRFNFMQAADAEQQDEQENENRGAVSSSAPATSDAEAGARNTPPSSPPSAGEPAQKETSALKQVEKTANGTISATLEDDQGMDVLGNVVKQAKQEVAEKQKQTSPAPSPSDPSLNRKASVRQFEKSKKVPQQITADFDDDDDLEIVQTDKPSRLAVFENVRSNKPRESHNLVALRALADLNGHERQRHNAKGSMTTAELQALLHRRAREQARTERDAKIQALRDKGVVVQTEEEKERDQLQFENMLEKARQEAEELAKKEKAERKKQGVQEGDSSGLMDSDDEEDEDYDGGDEGDVYRSGSEGDSDAEEETSEKEADEGEDAEESDTEEKAGDEGFFDNEAGEDSQDELAEQDVDDLAIGEDEVDVDNENVDIATPEPLFRRPQRARRTRVVDSDDEDENESNKKGLKAKTSDALSETPTTSKKAVTEAFGFGAQPSAFGLSQLFAGTMAEQDTQDDADESPTQDEQAASLEFLRGLQTSDVPHVDAGFPTQSQQGLVEASQRNGTEHSSAQDEQNSGLFRFETQSQVMPIDTQVFDAPDATQDMGFESPVPKGTAASYSTVDTVLVSQQTEEPTVKQRKRLHRRLNVLDNEDIVDDGGDKLETPANAFDAMRKATRKPVNVDEFDRTKSGAKEMVEEQAEESEDEYAGLGGASDDEDNGEGAEEVQKMIDDESNEKVDEAEIAAYYADKERQDDEKLAERLYKDIANGGLRRKRGADMDLWDSDDEDEAASRRRAAKQREFAKMRKALLADEKIGKIAENPKQAAFLQAIEDREEEEDDLDFLEPPEDSQSQVPDSQNDSTTMGPPPLRAISANTGKRKHSDLAEDSPSQVENRPPAQMRRTNKMTKPTSLVDIRNTVSELIGEPESVVDSQRLTPEQSSDDELEITNRDRVSASPVASALGGHSRRTPVNANRNAIIDRIALKRAGSSSLSNDAGSGRLAFHAPNSRASHTDLRTASLLRRATASSNGSGGSSESQASATATAAAGGAKEAVKMGGSKKSSVNYYVREKERRAKVEAVEKERMEGRIKVGKMRRQGLGLSQLAGGTFG